MEVQLYTEWDDNHVCTINQLKGGEEILHDHEKIPCDLKDHRQHGLIKKRYTLYQSFPEIKEPNAFLR